MTEQFPTALLVESLAKHLFQVPVLKPKVTQTSVSKNARQWQLREQTREKQKRWKKSFLETGLGAGGSSESARITGISSTEAKGFF